MEKLDILEIHKKYSNVYNGYELIGSYKLYVPIYKLKIKYDFLEEIKLSLIEECICKCLEREVNTIDEISFVLAIEKDILEYYINQLTELKYLQQDANKKIFFTDEGKILYSRLSKKNKIRCDGSVFLNTLNGEYDDDIVEKQESHEYLKLDDVIKDEASIILEPRICISDKETQIQEIEKYFLNSENGIKNINNINICQEKDLVYHSIELLIFKSEEKYKMLCYDNCGYKGIDNSITQVIQNLFEEKSLYEIIDENYRIKGILFTDILKNYENDLDLNEELLTNIREVINNEKDTLKYIMNYEIREKFLDYLDNAKESLYIISPWMNNYIINNEFICKLENLLKKGVKVRIIYGIGNKNELDENYRNKNTDNIANKLRNMGKPYKNLFKISHGKTHEKLLICDRKYYINGSFNFLSYSGEFENKFRNEGSTYSENIRLIEENIKLRFNE